ncbi:MAG TPA: MobA/MobL family protein, partial [Steroidobacteraceae bacterium]|nr:MobA/MobL family protein [Steroidobacteraceae bacterium]
NARVAREYILGLPHELAPAARRDLARGFARELADRFGGAVDLVMHAPRTDARNFHAHLLATTRVATPTGLGAKTSFEWSDTQRRRHGLARWRDELAGLRERWAVLSNEALRQAGLQARVSHHPDPDAGLRRGRAWLPRIAYEIEKRGGHSVLGDLVRQRYAVRMEARRQELALREFAIGSAAPEATRDVARDVAHNVAPDAARDMARALESGARPAPGRPRTLEEIRARALVEWQALRRQARETHQAAARHGWGASPQQQRDAGDERARERGRDSGYEHEL